MEALLLTRRLGRRGFEDAVWEARLARRPRVALDLQSASGSVATCAAVSACGRFSLAGGADAKISVYDLDRQRLVTRTARKPRTHLHSVVALAWHGGEADAFFSASCDGALCLWDGHRVKVVRRSALNRRVFAASLSACPETGTLVAAVRPNAPNACVHACMHA